MKSFVSDYAKISDSNYKLFAYRLHSSLSLSLPQLLSLKSRLKQRKLKSVDLATEGSDMAEEFMEELLPHQSIQVIHQSQSILHMLMEATHTQLTVHTQLIR